MTLAAPVDAHVDNPIELLKVITWRVPQVDASRLEAVTLAKREEAAVLEEVRDAVGAQELVYFPTCQRVILAATTPLAPVEVAARVHRAFAARTGARDLPAPEAFAAFPAFAHLSEVAASLDSLVPGEMQVLGQMKDAFKDAQTAGLVGRGGHGLTHVFPLVFRTAKAVRTNTDLFKGKVSLIPLTLDIVQEHLERVPGTPRVAVVGTGTMGAKMTELVKDAVPAAEVVAVSRNAKRGYPLADFLADPPAVDLIAFATRTDRPLFEAAHAEAVRARSDGRDLLLVDLSVPRCIANDVRDVDGVRLVSLDDLTALSEAAKADRRSELDRAREVLDAELARVEREYAALPAQRALARYRRAMDAAAEERYALGEERFGALFADPEFRKWFEQTTRHLAHVAQEHLHAARESAGTGHGDAGPVRVHATTGTRRAERKENPTDDDAH